MPFVVNKSGELAGTEEMEIGRGASPERPGSTLVLRRPHFRRVGDDLFFLISRRPHVRLSVNEAAIWAALECEPKIDDLRSRFPDLDQVLQRFVELGLCERAPTDFPTGRRRILVFEPHSDDAALSVGGTMWLRRHECEFTIVTIGSRSNFTSYYYLDRDYFNVEKISTLRKAEGALFARLLGGQHCALEQSEAALRYKRGDWSLAWFRRHGLSILAFVSHHSGVAELSTWVEAVRSALQDNIAEEIWLPLGGPHTDHQLTRDAFLILMRQDPKLFEGREVRFYQDVPYASRSPEFTATVVDALKVAGAVLRPEVVSISSVFAEKLHLVSLYGSQGKMHAVESHIKKCARMAAGDGGLAELFWLVEKPPTDLQPNSVRCDEHMVRRAAAKLAPWVVRHRNAERIRLLLLVPAGRWAEDMEYLLREFPRAQFDVYMAISSEAEQFVSPRIRVTHVGSGAKAWGRLALRLSRTWPVPTLFLAGEKRLRIAQWMSLLWPMSDPVVLPVMDHLVSALRR